MRGHGHGEKLTRLQSAAISALLTESSILAAAEKVGCTEKTLRQWLKDSDFLSAFRSASRAVLEHTIGKLQQVSGKAVGVLSGTLDSPSENTRLRGAVAVLDKTFRAAELSDLEQRLAAIEKLVKRDIR